MAETRWGCVFYWLPEPPELVVAGPHELHLGADGHWHLEGHDLFNAPGAGWAVTGAAEGEEHSGGAHVEAPGQALRTVFDTAAEAAAFILGVQAGGRSQRCFRDWPH